MLRMDANYLAYCNLVVLIQLVLVSLGGKRFPSNLLPISLFFVIFYSN